MTITHEVRSWSHFYDAIEKGDKKHDLRKNDRDFKIGDVLHMRRYDNIKGRYTGPSLYRKITYMTGRDVPCAFSSSALDREYCILSLEHVK